MPRRGYGACGRFVSRTLNRAAPLAACARRVQARAEGAIEGAWRRAALCPLTSNGSPSVGATAIVRRRRSSRARKLIADVARDGGCAGRRHGSGDQRADGGDGRFPADAQPHGSVGRRRRARPPGRQSGASRGVVRRGVVRSPRRAALRRAPDARAAGRRDRRRRPRAPQAPGASDAIFAGGGESPDRVRPQRVRLMAHDVGKPFPCNVAHGAPLGHADGAQQVPRPSCHPVLLQYGRRRARWCDSASQPASAMRISRTSMHRASSPTCRARVRGAAAMNARPAAMKRFEAQSRAFHVLASPSRSSSVMPGHAVALHSMMAGTRRTALIGG